MFLGRIAVAKGIFVPKMSIVGLGMRDLLSVFLCCHGKEIYNSDSHRNGVRNRQPFSQLIFVVNITFVLLQMNELLRFSLLPWKQSLTEPRRKQTVAIVPKDLCATYELCPTLKKRVIVMLSKL